MACGKNAGCLRIATSVYPGLQGEINSSISKISSSINEIISGLNGLSIPDDYLGTKVKSRVSAICSGLGSDASEVGALGGKINGFVGNKIQEHNEHYRTWKAEQQLRIQRAKEREREKKLK